MLKEIRIKLDLSKPEVTKNQELPYFFLEKLLKYQ
jgi:hypothetical protein